MKALLYIFIGGGIGSVLRYLVTAGTQKLWAVNSWPMGTFVVNILGGLLIGFLSAYYLKTDSTLKFMLITGFCGGFTTFSTFSSENYSLYQNGNYAMLLLYVVLSVVIGILAVAAGFYLFRSME